MLTILRSSLTISFYTLLSRIIGLVRDIFIAAALGATVVSDAFFIAFRVPNLFRRLTAEGAFNSAFLPMFSSILVRDQKSAKNFGSDIFSIMFFSLAILTILFVIFMPYIMHVIAPGFSANYNGSDEQFNLAVNLTRITFPYILFISLVALYSAILNSREKFAAVAATPILLNVFLLAAVAYFYIFIGDKSYALALAVTLAGIAQFCWLMYFVIREGLLPSLRFPSFSPDVRKFFRLFIPAAVGSGVIQINLFIDNILASTLDQAVSYLYYSSRLYEFPLALIGIAVGTALLPPLSRYIELDDKKKSTKLFAEAINLSMFLAIPSTVALIIIANPVMLTLFQRGEFSASDAAESAYCLQAFIIGLPAFILIKIFSPVYYAHKDTTTPFRIAGFCVMVNLFFNIILMQFFAHIGLALATSISAVFNALILGYYIRRKSLISKITGKNYNIISRMLPIFSASFIMGLFLFSAVNFYQYIFFTDSTLLKILTLSLIILAGAIIYLFIVAICNFRIVITDGKSKPQSIIKQLCNVISRNR